MFTEHALPYCVFSAPGLSPRAGAGLGAHIIDLQRTFTDPVFAQPDLNAFLARGPRAWQRIRERLTGLVQAGDALPTVAISEATLHLPVAVADFTDFYSSLEHATNAGQILRPDSPALAPNWREMPVGYHGRAGTIVVSGTPVLRPRGQVAPAHGRPSLTATRRLDFEAELGFLVGAGSSPGQQVRVDDFARHVFGVVVLIDWSARDIQAFESRPLGPFLAKSFATTISPWVVPLAALDHAWVPPPRQDPEPLGYLRSDQPWGLDIDLAIYLNGQWISQPRFAAMYWTAAQQLAHLTVNGAALRTGDLYGSGTVSSFRREEQGCLLELTRNGQQPIMLADGETHGYLADGDTVTISASAPGPGRSRIDFGWASGQVTSPLAQPEPGSGGGTGSFPAAPPSWPERRNASSASPGVS